MGKHRLATSLVKPFTDDVAIIKVLGMGSMVMDLLETCSGDQDGIPVPCLVQGPANCFQPVRDEVGLAWPVIPVQDVMGDGERRLVAGIVTCDDPHVRRTFHHPAHAGSKVGRMIEGRAEDTD